MATREEIYQAIQQADANGAYDDAKQLAEMYNSTPATVIEPPSVMDNVVQAATNFPDDLVNTVSNTAQGIVSIPGKLYDDFNRVSSGDMNLAHSKEQVQQQTGLGKQIAQSYADKYGSVDRARDTFVNHPAEMLLDMPIAGANMVAKGVTTLPGKVVHGAGKVIKAATPDALTVVVPNHTLARTLGKTTGAGSANFDALLQQDDVFAPIVRDNMRRGTPFPEMDTLPGSAYDRFDSLEWDPDTAVSAPMNRILPNVPKETYYKPSYRLGLVAGAHIVGGPLASGTALVGQSPRLMGELANTIGRVKQGARVVKDYATRMKEAKLPSLADTLKAQLLLSPYFQNQD